MTTEPRKKRLKWLLKSGEILELGDAQMQLIELRAAGDSATVIRMVISAREPVICRLQPGDLHDVGDVSLRVIHEIHRGSSACQVKVTTHGHVIQRRLQRRRQIAACDLS